MHFSIELHNQLLTFFKVHLRERICIKLPSYVIPEGIQGLAEVSYMRTYVHFCS